MYANSTIDAETDRPEDEAESPILGHETCEAGKLKGKKDYLIVYMEDIGLKSGTGMKKLRLYVDCRGNAKRARLQAKWAAIKEEQKAKAAHHQMPVEGQSKGLSDPRNRQLSTADRSSYQCRYAAEPASDVLHPDSCAWTRRWWMGSGNAARGQRGARRGLDVGDEQMGGLRALGRRGLSTG